MKNILKEENKKILKEEEKENKLNEITIIYNLGKYDKTIKLFGKKLQKIIKNNYKIITDDIEQEIKKLQMLMKI